MPRLGVALQGADDAEQGEGRGIFRRSGEHVAADAGGLVEALGLRRGLGAGQRLVERLAARGHGGGGLLGGGLRLGLACRAIGGGGGAHGGQIALPVGRGASGFRDGRCPGTPRERGSPPEDARTDHETSPKDTCNSLEISDVAHSQPSGVRSIGQRLLEPIGPVLTASQSWRGQCAKF